MRVHTESRMACVVGGRVGADSWQFEKMTRDTRGGQLATSSFWGVPEPRGNRDTKKVLPHRTVNEQRTTRNLLVLKG